MEGAGQGRLKDKCSQKGAQRPFRFNEERPSDQRNPASPQDQTWIWRTSPDGGQTRRAALPAMSGQGQRLYFGNLDPQARWPLLRSCTETCTQQQPQPRLAGDPARGREGGAQVWPDVQRVGGEKPGRVCVCGASTRRQHTAPPSTALVCPRRLQRLAAMRVRRRRASPPPRPRRLPTLAATTRVCVCVVRGPRPRRPLQRAGVTPAGV